MTRPKQAGRTKDSKSRKPISTRVPNPETTNVPGAKDRETARSRPGSHATKKAGQSKVQGVTELNIHEHDTALKHGDVGGDHIRGEQHPPEFVATFDVGECLNMLRFHLVQVALLFDADHLAETRRVLDRLGRLVRLLVRPRDRAPLRAQVIAPIEALLDRLNGGRHYENLTEVNIDLWDQFPDVDLDRARREFVGPVERALVDARTSIQGILPGDERGLLMMQLGEVIDQGNRPLDLDQFFDTPPQLLPMPTDPPRQIDPEDIRRSRSRSRVDLLANTSRWGGETPPVEAWADEVRLILEELSLIDSVPIGLLAPQYWSVVGHAEAIRRLVDSVRAILRGPVLESVP